jgi:hypothetical protein
MHEGDQYHESVSGDDTPDVLDMTAAPAVDRANDQREPRKFFPRVKMLLSFDYEPVRRSVCVFLVLNSLVCIAESSFGNHPYRVELDFSQ